MGKCILVMDMPESCARCPMYHESMYYEFITSRCVVTDKRQDNRSYDFKPSWCPLKPIPQKIGVDEAINMPRNGNIVDVIKSYNACIDEILGGTE